MYSEKLEICRKLHILNTKLIERIYTTGFNIVTGANIIGKYETS